MRRRPVIYLVAALAAGAAYLGTAAPASAAPLTGVNWSISGPLPGDTGVRYSWSFTTATTATLSAVTFTVPAGTAGASLTVADVYGVPSGGTATLSGTTVTYTFSTPTSIAAGVSAVVSIDGFTNTSTPGSYTSTVTTLDSQATPAPVDTAASSAVEIAANTTGVTLVVARSTYLSNDTSSFTLLMDPTTNAERTKVVNLVVKTNAGAGYALNVKATALTGSAGTIAAGSTGTANSWENNGGKLAANRWGYAVAALSGDAVGVRQGVLATGKHAGYTTGGEAAVSAAGATNNDGVAITNRVKIDYEQPAGTYGSTITYTIVPTF